jgi:hypothetical protein
MASFSTINDTFSPKESDKRVESITVKLILKDATGEAGVTDIQLQSGSISTKWSGHPSEIRWQVDG